MRSSNDYRLDVDGLRAVAVILVVLCHAKFKSFAGGFIGVDVFFVISGYVVTLSLTRSMSTERFSFVDFYVRRAKRLAPALYVVLSATFVFGVLFLIPDDAMELAKNIAYAALFASNIYLAKQTGYFDAGADHQPLLHTWSLSVEEQFYLLLPVVLFLLRRSQSHVRVAVVMALTIASLWAAQWAVASARAGAYYFAQYRAFEFLIGVLMSLNACRVVGSGHKADIALAGGMLILVLGAVQLGTATFPGAWALVPCVGAALAVYGGGGRLGRVLLCNRPMVWIGERSYSIYLWHWPIFFAARRFGYQSAQSMVIAIGVTVVLATLCHRYIESPLRYHRMSARRAGAMYLGVPILAAFSLVGVGRASTNFLFLYPHEFRSVYARSADQDWVGGRGLKCWGKVAISSESDCSGGASNGRKAVLWGDSHAYQFVYFFDALGKEFGYRVHDLTRPACPPIEDVPDGPRDMDKDCRAYNKTVMAYVLRDRLVTTVFMSATWASYTGSTDGSGDARFRPGLMAQSLTDTIRKLEAAGKKVVLVDDVAPIPDDLVNCQLYNRMKWQPEERRCDFPQKLTTATREANESVFGPVLADLPDVKVIHTYGATCTTGRCHVSYDGVPLYRNNDATHLNLSGGEAYYRLYRSVNPNELEQVLGPVATRAAFPRSDAVASDSQAGSRSLLR